MTVEVERNERFIQKYVFDDIKEEKREQGHVQEVEEDDLIEHSAILSSHENETSEVMSTTISEVSNSLLSDDSSTILSDA